MIEYNNYSIQVSDYSCIIRDSSGKYVGQTMNEDEAMEFIDDLNEETEKPINENDLYTQFCRYCKSLPGKCYIDDKLATTNEEALLRFIKPFEKQNNVRIKYSMIIKGCEHFYIIDEIY